MATIETEVAPNQIIQRKMHAIQTLVRKVVHDTNNYYGIIQGYLSLIDMNKGADDQMRKYLPPLKEAVQSGINLNRRLARLYRTAHAMVVQVDLAILAREVCEEFSREHDFPVAVDVAGEVAGLHLDEVAVRSLVGDLCHLAMAGKTAQPQMRIFAANLDEEAIQGMILESGPGGYVGLRSTVDLDQLDQFEDTEFINPFAPQPEAEPGIGLADLYCTARDHRGNLDVNVADNQATITLYFPRAPR